MRNTLTLFIITAVVAACTPDPVPDSPREFSYDEIDGLCKNRAGLVGFNEIDLPKIRLSRDCECMKFSKIEVLELAGDTIQIPVRFGYYELTEYNFKGAVLDSCNLFFNLVLKADLRGADLSTLQYGYAFVTGRIDEFTKVPLEGTVEIDGDSVRCSR